MGEKAWQNATRNVLMLLEERVLCVPLSVCGLENYFSPSHSLFLMELIMPLFPVLECAQWARGSLKGNVFEECLEARGFSVVTGGLVCVVGSKYCVFTHLILPREVWPLHYQIISHMKQVTRDTIGLMVREM